ncbi:MAG: glycosyltransferase [Kiloniellales bacterium]
MRPGPIIEPAVRPDAQPALSPRKQAIRDLSDRIADARDDWIRRNAGYYADDRRYMRFLIPPQSRVLEIGCGTGQLLAALEPARGVGLDLSPRMVEVARRKHPNLVFQVGDVEDPGTLEGLGGPFDFIVLSDTIGLLEDFQAVLDSLHRLCTRDTRIVVAYYSKLWEPVLKLAERLGLKMPQVEQNWFSTDDIVSLMELTDYQAIRREWRQPLPKRLMGLGPLINRTLGGLPGVRRLSLRNYIVARPMREVDLGRPSVSVVVPCRNERGNVEAAVLRMPRLCDDIEIIYVEGGSSDGTYEECLRVRDAYPDRDIKVLRQPGKGKNDAVRTGFATARGQVLMILDADLTVPPEDLAKFYQALVTGKGNFINGSRLIYPMAEGAMPHLNYWANRSFAKLFSWLLNQRITDTLCGTKALTKADYQRIVEDRAYFGEFDPFGDFDLILGATKQHLKIIEIPIRYHARRYGASEIAPFRFRHGVRLARAVGIAWRKMKAI